MEQVMNIISNRAAALGVLSALAIAVAAPAWAGPLPTNTAAVKAAAPGQVTDIRWRGGRGIGPGLAFGLAAGALAGAAVAAQPYGPGYYYEEPVYGPGYGAPVYAQPYGYEPVYPVQQYYAPGYRYGGQCFTDEGYGRRRPCSSN
jgi:hypothetical protein